MITFFSASSRETDLDKVSTLTQPQHLVANCPGTRNMFLCTKRTNSQLITRQDANLITRQVATQRSFL